LSYAHDRSVPGHAQRALDLTDSLRERGVDAWIDRYDEHSGVHWPRWMKDQVKRAQFVLCLASPLYRERFEQAGGTPDVGRGARWEGAIITEELYEQQQVGPKKFIAVVMPGTSSEDIPDVLNPIGWTHYTLPDDDESLYRRLTNQPAVVPPPLGPTIRFPPGRP
jgi:TIR domain